MRQTDQAGFSLIEMSIVLTVIGIVLSIALPYGGTFLETTRTKATRDKQERIFMVLANYVARHGGLPCPTHPESPADQFGLAPPGCVHPKDWIGILPFRTLGIPERMAKDGFGFWMTYAMNPSLYPVYRPQVGIHVLDGYCSQRDGGLNVVTGQGQPTISPTLPHGAPGDFVAAVLISHGPHGRGAFLQNPHGIRQRTPTPHPDEIKNTQDSGQFVIDGTAVGSHEPFSHIVDFRSRDQLLTMIGLSCGAHIVQNPQHSPSYAADEAPSKEQSASTTPPPQSLNPNNRRGFKPAHHVFTHDDD